MRIGEIFVLATSARMPLPSMAGVARVTVAARAGVTGPGRRRRLGWLGQSGRRELQGRLGRLLITTAGRGGDYHATNNVGVTAPRQLPTRIGHHQQRPISTREVHLEFRHVVTREPISKFRSHRYWRWRRRVCGSGTA
jgi:hypothetical protein